MALICWIPLNGDLTQQGTENTTFSGTPTWKTYGKIGNAALNLQNRITCTTTALNGVQFFSVTFWARIENNPDSTANWMDVIGFTDQTSSGTNGQFRFETGYGNSAYSGVHWHDNATNAIINGSYTYNTGTEFDKWHHIAVTISDTEVCSYYDGILKSTITTNLNKGHLTGAWWLGESTTRGCIQDVRIYDHALSAAEVREIAQGLVLHYKFNKSNPNLLQSVPKSYTPTAYCGYQLNFTENLVAGQTYTLQLWDIDVAHSAKSAAALGLDFYWGGGSVILKQLHGTSYFNDGHANYICVTITPTAANASGSGATNAWFNVYNSVGNADGTRNMHIGAWKLEKGDVGTPWIDARQESIIEDNSGYQHNGIIAGAVTGSAENKRYDTSTYLPNGQTDYITTQDNVGYFTNNITMNIWFKSANKSPGSDYHHCFNSLTSWTYIEMAVHKNGYLRCGLYINGTRYVANTDNTNILDGNWHMLTMTYDGANVKRYVDGILKSTQAATGNLNTASDKFVFGRGASTGYCCKEAYLSDARLYVTALSEDDVLNLYHTSAKIDSAQRLHAFEFNEFSPKIQLTAAGEMKCTELTESTSTKFYKTQAISSNYLIEY